MVIVIDGHHLAIVGPSSAVCCAAAEERLPIFLFQSISVVGHHCISPLATLKIVHFYRTVEVELVKMNSVIAIDTATLGKGVSILKIVLVVFGEVGFFDLFSVRDKL